MSELNGFDDIHPKEESNKKYARQKSVSRDKNSGKGKKERLAQNSDLKEIGAIVQEISQKKDRKLDMKDPKTMAIEVLRHEDFYIPGSSKDKNFDFSKTAVIPELSGEAISEQKFPEKLFAKPEKMERTERIFEKPSETAPGKTVALPMQTPDHHKHRRLDRFKQKQSGFPIAWILATVAIVIFLILMILRVVFF